MSKTTEPPRSVLRTAGQIQTEYDDATNAWKKSLGPYIRFWLAGSICAGTLMATINFHHFLPSLVVGTLISGFLLAVPVVVVYRLKNSEIVRRRLQLGRELTEKQETQSSASASTPASKSELPASIRNPAVKNAGTSASKCSACGGGRVWIVVGVLGLEPRCLDCNVMCDCNMFYPKHNPRRTSADGLACCPRCHETPPVEVDRVRVKHWIAMIKEHRGGPVIVELLGRIGPAGRVAVPLLESLYREFGKGDALGCAAYDALREHKMNKHIR